MHAKRNHAAIVRDVDIAHCNFILETMRAGKLVTERELAHTCGTNKSRVHRLLHKLAPKYVWLYRGRWRITQFGRETNVAEKAPEILYFGSAFKDLVAIDSPNRKNSVGDGSIDSLFQRIEMRPI